MPKRIVIVLILLTIIFSTFSFLTILTRAVSINIQFGQVVSATINPAGDADTYKFMALAGDSIYIRMRSGFAEGLHPQLRLYGPNGSEIQRNSFASSLGVTAEISCVFNETGEYTALAMDDIGSKTGSYGIFFYRFNTPQDTLQYLDFDEPKVGNIDVLGDVDCYKLSALKDDSVLIRATGNPARANFWMQLYLFNSNGSRIIKTPFDMQVPEISCVLNETDTYVIMSMCISAYQIGQSGDNSAFTGSYTLTANLIAGPTPSSTSSSPSPTLTQLPTPTSVTPSPTTTGSATGTPTITLIPTPTTFSMSPSPILTNSPCISPNVQPTTSQSALCSERYHNTQYGWSIVPPKDWAIDDKDSGKVLFSPHANSFEEVALLKIIAVHTDKELSAFVEYAKSISDNDFNVISQLNQQIAGYTCEVVSWSSSFVAEDSSIVELRCKNFHFVENGTGYVITFQGQPVNYDSYLASIEENLQTFEINPVPASADFPFLSLAIVGAVIVAIVAAIILFVNKRQKAKPDAQTIKATQLTQSTPTSEDVSNSTPYNHDSNNKKTTNNLLASCTNCGAKTESSSRVCGANEVDEPTTNDIVATQKNQNKESKEEIFGSIRAWQGLGTNTLALIFTTQRIIVAKITGHSSFLSPYHLLGPLGAGIEQGKYTSDKTKQFGLVTPEMILAENEKSYAIQYSQIININMKKPNRFSTGRIVIQVGNSVHDFTISNNGIRFKERDFIFLDRLPQLLGDKLNIAES
jgi:hypothetical protein